MERVVYKMIPNEINTILYHLEGKQFKPLTVDFDFENEVITINDKKTLRVEHDREFTYKFMKTKVKAIDGIKGLYRHIKEAAEPGAFWNNTMYSVLLRAAN